ncbi:MAG: DUF3179 domain-containing protein [Rhodothermales bacterium]
MVSVLLTVALTGLLPTCVMAQATNSRAAVVLQSEAWATDTDKRSIDLDELQAGGPPKDGIPAIDEPRFVSSAAAEAWLAPQEPVVALALGGEAKAYPLQILTWHEIVNDEVGGVPVAVTFCPLCYSAVAYRRTLDGRPLTFGVSGFLRHSDLVMYDRQTESLWQQLTGEAIVGAMTGAQLEALPAQIISFAQFREAYPEGTVLSRETGLSRPYGRNPYAGYDDVDEKPFLYRGPYDKRLPPMEKVVAVSLGGEDKAYPHRVTKAQHVIHDRLGGRPVVVFHSEGAVSALDADTISASREIGSTGVFDPRLDGEALRFRYQDGRFIDEKTESVWDVTGRATSGPLEGKQLQPIPHGNYFSFAWFAFKPETNLYQPEPE